MDLTHRQGEVLRLMAAGFTDAEMAKQLGVSKYTANNHIQNILNRLGACNRPHAVAIAFRKGILK